jgi:hypothetical protein
MTAAYLDRPVKPDDDEQFNIRHRIYAPEHFAGAINPTARIFLAFSPGYDRCTRLDVEIFVFSSDL